jgi:hypothetical protein
MAAPVRRQPQNASIPLLDGKTIRGTQIGEATFMRLQSLTLAALLILLTGCGKSTGVGGIAGDALRWAAELLNHAVFGQPDHTGAKELLARTYDHMGYMAEAATWRNNYLTAAAELRNGRRKRASIAAILSRCWRKLQSCVFSKPWQGVSIGPQQMARI